MTNNTDIETRVEKLANALGRYKSADPADAIRTYGNGDSRPYGCAACGKAYKQYGWAYRHVKGCEHVAEALKRAEKIRRARERRPETKADAVRLALCDLFAKHDEVTRAELRAHIAKKFAYGEDEAERAIRGVIHQMREEGQVARVKRGVLGRGPKFDHVHAYAKGQNDSPWTHEPGLPEPAKDDCPDCGAPRGWPCCAKRDVPVHGISAGEPIRGFHDGRFNA